MLLVELGPFTGNLNSLGLLTFTFGDLILFDICSVLLTLKILRTKGMCF